jgi:hypothetical protein
VRTKNAAPITTAEHQHLGRVKALPCSVCDLPGQVEAHHIVQGLHYTAIAVCPDCHRGSFAGWHGQKRAWIARKLDEIAALNITLKRLME